MKNQLQIRCLSSALVGLTVGLTIGTAPALAQAIRLGNDIQIDLNRQKSELRPRISSDGDRVNVEIYEQPQPETRVRITNDGFDVREVQPQPEQRLELSVPLDQRR
jgi:hypothetical protein